MKMKKLGAVLMAAAFIMSASAGVADAAKGGARISTPKVSAPKVSAPSTKSSSSASSATKKDTPNTKDYAPSKKASEYGDSAPTAKSNTSTAANSATAAANTAANTATSGTRWGSALRTVGMLAGGMMLGSMLGHMLGFGTGWMSDVLGVVANIAIFAFVLCVLNILVRRLMGAFGGRSRSNGNKGAAQPRSRRREDANTIDVPYEEVNVQSAPVQDIKPPSGAGQVAPGRYRDYDAKATAERYRKM